MKLKPALTPYLLILPALALLFFLFLYPIGWNVYLSFHDVEFQTFWKKWNFVGLENYRDLFNDAIFPRKFYKSLVVSASFVGGSVLGQFLIGLGLALILHRNFKGTGAFRVLITIPWILSDLVVAYIWLFLYQQNGAINGLLQSLSLPGVNWLGNQNMAIWSLVITNIWFGTPFTMLMMGSALKTINPELYEAAAVDGANTWQTFRRITWVLLKPFVALNLILITMWTTNLFALPLAMTRGGPLYATTTTALYMYRYAFEFGKFSVGSSIGVLLFLFNIAAAAVYLRMLRREG
ncbi:MAG: carbohydrate ABC transporter permease [Candidatus Bipolaricaulia bacterium]